MAKFPTYTSYNETCTIRGREYINEFTRAMDSLTITDYPEDYYLGWIRPENVSEMLKETYVEMQGTGDSRELVAIPPTYSVNVPVGYYLDRNSSLGGFSHFLFRDKATGGATGNFNKTISGTPCFINKFYPENYGVFRYCRFAFLYVLYAPAPDSSLVVTPTSVNFTLNDYNTVKAFCDGQYTQSISLAYTPSGSSTPLNLLFKIKGSDFTDGTAIYDDDNGSGYQARFFFVAGDIDGMNAGNTGTSNSGSCIVPFTKIVMNFETSDPTTSYVRTVMQGTQSVGVTTHLATIEYNSAGIYNIRFNTYSSVVASAGGIPARVSFRESDIIDNTKMLIYNGGILIAKEQGSDKRLYVYHPIDEFEKFIDLFVKVNKAAIQSYVSGISYAANVSDTDEFLDTIKTGDIFDETFRNGLREWQYVPLDDDGTDQGTGDAEFYPEEMPPYDPNPPTPEPGEEGHNPDNPDLNLGITEDVPGDSVETAEYRDTSITFPISAFLTQYVLSAQDIFDMGHSLWSGIGDPNSLMASNFVKTYTSTGTLNISNVIDFFVSVKVFPFDIADFNIITLKPAMTIGTGAVPLLNYTVPVLNVSTYVLDCGTVNTLQEGAFRLSATDYDFRNYINCTYTVFLPFCGNIELNPADVFPYELSCKYFIDFISGSCTGCVYALRDNKEVLVGSKTGQIGKIVPITASNVNAIIGSALSDVSHVVQTIGSAVVSAATNKALGANTAPVNEASKNADYLHEMADYRAKQSAISAKGSAQQNAVGMVSGAIGGLGNMMSRSGIGIPTLSGGTGLDALHISKRPYLAIRRLNYCSPNQYAHTTGFAGTDGSSSKPLRNYQGWTVLENPDLSGIKATQEELSEIKYLLETGVYI